MFENIFFVGMLQSDEEAEEKKYVSVAGNGFQKRFINVTGINEVINIKYIDDNSENGLEINDIRIHELFGFLKYGPRIIKIFYKIILNAVHFSLILFTNKNKNKIVFYNIDYNNAILILMAKFIHKRKVIVIAADLNGKPVEIIDKIYGKIYSMVDGVISLRNTFNFNKNMIVVPAILNKVEKSNFVFQKKNLQTVLFSGSIGYTTGIDLLLDVSKQCKEFTFTITGKPYQITDCKIQNLVNDAKSLGAKIEYLGMLKEDEYKEILKRSAFGVSFRRPEDVEHQFNFPSKITEYASHGLVVLSTIAYEELDSEVCIQIDYKTEDIISTLRNLTSTRDKYEHIQKASEDAVKKHSIDNVRDIIKNFLRDV